MDVDETKATKKKMQLIEEEEVQARNIRRLR